MSSADYPACKYSATLRIDDEAVLHMIRGLSQYCESGKYKQIAWGGTKTKSWRTSGGSVTFRFSAPADRDLFLSKATRLLPAGMWALLGTNDNDPASRQR